MKSTTHRHVKSSHWSSKLSCTLLYLPIMAKRLEPLLVLWRKTKNSLLFLHPVKLSHSPGSSAKCLHIWWTQGVKNGVDFLGHLVLPSH